MKVLFICNQNKHRSKTAEEIFRDKFETKSAGLYNNLVSSKDLEWADLIVVMEQEQRTELGKRFPSLYLQKKIVSFDIPDNFYYNQPGLIEILKIKMNKLIEPLIE